MRETKLHSIKKINARWLILTLMKIKDVTDTARLQGVISKRRPALSGRQVEIPFTGQPGLHSFPLGCGCLAQCDSQADFASSSVLKYVRASGT
jgi:hypothetical protein